MDLDLDSGGSAAPRKHAVLSNYPAYVSTPRPRPVKIYSPLVSSIGAYAASFAVHLVAAFPLGYWVVDHGMTTIATGGSITRAAAQAALVVMATLLVVGVLGSWVFLWFRKVPSALLVAFLSQVAYFILASLGRQVSGLTSVVLGAVAGIGTAWALIVWRRMRDSNPRGR
jgi:hypothetical protein